MTKLNAAISHLKVDQETYDHKDFEAAIRLLQAAAKVDKKQAKKCFRLVPVQMVDGGLEDLLAALPDPEEGK